MTVDTDARTRCSSRVPFNFCPSSANCQARMPVASTGTVEIAATRKVKWAASAMPPGLVCGARKANSPPAANSAIGKWINTTCCACLASSTVLGSKGFTLIGRSLHNDRAGHFRVDGAQVRIGSGFGEGKREFLVGIEHLGLEHLVRTDNRVRNIIAIGPGDRRSDSHSQSRRSKTEIIDFHFRTCGLL